MGGSAREDATTGGCSSSGLGDDGGSDRKGVRGTARGNRAEDVIPSEWGDAPAELCPPEASSERECEVSRMEREG